MRGGAPSRTRAGRAVELSRNGNLKVEYATGVARGNKTTLLPIYFGFFDKILVIVSNLNRFYCATALITICGELTIAHQPS